MPTLITVSTPIDPNQGQGYLPALTPSPAGTYTNPTITLDRFGRAVNATNGSGGSVTSVGLSLPVDLTVSNSPVTSSGTLTAVWANQNANLVHAGPATGASAAPTWRSLVAADIPSLPASQITSGQLALDRGGSNADLSGTGPGFLKQATLGANVTVAALVASDIPTLTLSKISDAGTMAAENSNSVSITGGSLSGVTLDNSAIGSTTPSTGVFTTAYVGALGGPAATELMVITTSIADPRGIMSAQYSTDTNASRIHLRKARGTPAAPTTIVSGDILGRLRFSGYDGSNFLQMASIDAVSTGTIASTRVPTYLSFSVATDAAPSVLTEVGRLTITGLNNTVIGATTPSAITGTTITANTAFVGPIHSPSSDSTTAIQVTKADKSTAILVIDSTNSRIGIGSPAPTPGTTLQLGDASHNATFSVYAGSTSIFSTSTSAPFVTSQGLTINTYVSFAGWWSASQSSGGGISFGSGHGIAWGNTTTNLQSTSIAGDTVVSRSGVGQLSIKGSDAATSSVTNAAILDHATSSTPTAGYGTGLLFQGQSATVTGRAMGRIRTSWTTATDLSRASKMVLSTYNGASEVDAVTIDSNGVLYPIQAPTASAPAYVKGGVYFDTTLNKLRIGGASGWETITSV